MTNRPTNISRDKAQVQPSDIRVVFLELVDVLAEAYSANVANINAAPIGATKEPKA